MNYIEVLRSKGESLQENIENVLEQNKTQPVGSGFIDIITDIGLAEKLINELTTLGIAVNGVTWWCYCSEENQKEIGYPHGMGGPKSAYKAGWYSEMGIEYGDFDIPENVYDKFEHGYVTIEEVKALNESVGNYIREFSNEEQFYKCLTPALWLHVPKEWKRIKYMKR